MNTEQLIEAKKKAENLKNTLIAASQRIKGKKPKALHKVMKQLDSFINCHLSCNSINDKFTELTDTLKSLGDVNQQALSVQEEQNETNQLQ